MKIRRCVLAIILMGLLISCTNPIKDSEPQTNQPDTIVPQVNPDLVIEKSIEKNIIIEQLQGRWKEIAYPFRTAEFVNSKVKFVEEGTADNPVFEAYEIAGFCPIENNNIRDTSSSDIILVLPESGRCEKLNIAADTLTLSGFSSNTKENYNIVYLRLN